MVRLSLPARRDPNWGTDGPTARREHLRRQAVSMAAFAAALTAVGATAFAWSVELGLAAAFGIHARILFG
jgi:hypothetical protein